MKKKRKIVKMANKIYGKIKIDTVEDRCFYHVLRDYIEYGDLESVVVVHPELEETIKKHRFDLERELLQQRELLGIEKDTVKV